MTLHALIPHARVPVQGALHSLHRIKGFLISLHTAHSGAIKEYIILLQHYPQPTLHAGKHWTSAQPCPTQLARHPPAPHPHRPSAIHAAYTIGTERVGRDHKQQQQQ